jgi:hypothetical protein
MPTGAPHRERKGRQVVIVCMVFVGRERSPAAPKSKEPSMKRSVCWTAAAVGRTVLFTVLVFSSLLLLPTKAQDAPQDLRWSCSFEADEGFDVRAPLGGSIASLIGGSAAVLTGDAAEGMQFVRFTAANEGDALVLRTPGEVSAGLDREISFAVRLAPPKTGTRMVLTYGETITLESLEGGVQVEVPDRAPVRIIWEGGANGWTQVGIVEDARAATWQLVVDGKVVASELSCAPGPSLLSDLLIFADGSLDIDAVRIVAHTGIAPTPMEGHGGTISGSAGSPKAGVPTEPEPQETDSGRKAYIIGGAVTNARAWNFAAALLLLSSLADPGRDDAAHSLEQGVLVAQVAFIVHDEGYYREAAVLAVHGLRRLEDAKLFVPGTRSKLRLATCDFVAAQLREQVLFDLDGAEELFQRALGNDPKHSGAQDGVERVRRKRAESRAQPLGDGKGGAR